MENNTAALTAPNAGRITVMSKSGYSPRPQSGAGGGVMSILISLLLIFQGLSGRYVLRGTNSSRALVLVGLAFLVLDILKIVERKKQQEKAESEYSARYSRVSRVDQQVRTDERALPGTVNVRVTYDKSLAAMDIVPRLNGRAMTQNAKSREFTGATDRVKNIVSFMTLDLTAVFEIPEDSGEIVIELFKDKTGFGVAIPEGAALLPSA